MMKFFLQIIPNLSADPLTAGVYLLAVSNALLWDRVRRLARDFERVFDTKLKKENK